MLINPQECVFGAVFKINRRPKAGALGRNLPLQPVKCRLRARVCRGALELDSIAALIFEKGTVLKATVGRCQSESKNGIQSESGGNRCLNCKGHVGSDVVSNAVSLTQCSSGLVAFRFG